MALMMPALKEEESISVTFLAWSALAFAFSATCGLKAGVQSAVLFHTSPLSGSEAHGSRLRDVRAAMSMGAESCGARTVSDACFSRLLSSSSLLSILS